MAVGQAATEFVIECANPILKRVNVELVKRSDLARCFVEAFMQTAVGNL
jgi:hypothetical protein